MVQNHLSRLAVPKIWEIYRKKYKWAVRPSPGPHGLKDCIPLTLLLRDVLGYAKTSREVRKILNDGNVFVDGVVRKDHKFPVGFMDVVSIPNIDSYFRIVYDRYGRFKLVPLDKKETGFKILKVEGKTILKGGKLQLNFHDGKNMLSGVKCNSGDSVLYNVGKKKVEKVLKLEKGCLVFLSGGKYVGSVVKIKDIVPGKDMQTSKFVFDLDGMEHVTLLDYAFVVGKAKPEVKVEESK